MWPEDYATSPKALSSKSPAGPSTAGSSCRPTPEIREVILGVLGRAQRKYKVSVHAVVYMSTHAQLLVTPGSAKRLSRFMGFVNGNVAKKVGKRVRWRQRLWSRPFQAILVSEEERAQTKRLHYTLSHGAKEGFCYSPLDWPGVHAAEAMVTGAMRIEGTWFDDTKAHHARQRGLDPGPRDFAEPETLHLTPLPCWQHLDPETYRLRIEEMIRDIEAETLERHRQRNTAPTGISFLFQQDPHTKPRKTKRSPAPAFHAATKTALLDLWNAYRQFVADYRQAAERLKDGDRDAEFPPGSFPPALPFVEDLAPG